VTAPSRRSVDLPDFGAIALGPNPTQTMRVLGLVRAGSSYARILELGHYQRSWSRADVDRILSDNRVALPDPPDPAPHSAKLTSARTVVLTGRQMQMCHYLCQGQDDSEIAEATGLALATVRNHIQKTLKATGCRDRLSLAVAILTGQLVPVLEEAGNRG
jgi:DNA-binding NarL/FixJ family response regulator